MNLIARHLLPAGFLVAVLATPAAAQDATNHVTGLTVEEAEAHTVIRIDGDAHPTYSVYQLPNPRRLFVDIADSELDAVDAALDIDNGVVSRVAAVEYEDGVATVTRVVIGFDTAAHYDVVSDGDDLVVTIDGADRRAFIASTPTSPAEFARLEVELEASRGRLGALSSALADAESRASDAEAEILREQLAREQAEQERLSAVAARHDAEARATALEGELTARDNDLARLSAERESALARIAELESNVVAANDELSEREAEVARLGDLRAELDDRIAAARLANTNTEALEAERAAALTELDALASELSQMQAIADASAAALEDARAEARAAQSAQQDLALRQQALVAELNAAEAAHAEQAAVIANQQAALSALARERDEAIERVSAAEAGPDVEARANALAAELSEREQELARLTSEREQELARLTSEREQELARLTSEREQELARLSSEWEQELAGLSTEREAALARIAELESDVAFAMDALSAREAEVERLGELRTELDARIAAARSANANTEALEAERAAALAELNTLSRDLEQMQAAANANNTALDEARAEARAAQSAQQDLMLRQQDLITELGRADAARAEQARVIASQQAELDALARERDAAVERASTVEELQQRWQATSNEIRDVRFEHVDGVDRVVIEVDAGVEFASAPWTDGRAAITFSDAVLPDALRRTLDTQAFDGPVGFVSSYADADGTVHVVADLQNAASELLRQEGGQLVWEFTEMSALAADEPSAMPLASGPDVLDEAWSTGLTSYGPDAYTLTSGGASTSSNRRPVMTRKRITIDLRDADIQNVLRLIADEGNINVVASDDVGGTVTLRLRSVPLDEALSIILRSNGLGWEQEGNIIRVAPIEVFEEEYERELQRMADAFGLEPLQVRLVPVNYAEAEELSGLVGNVLSSRGSVAVDMRNNTLVVTDINAHLETAQELVRQLDSQTPQILIEARIVETNDQFRRQLGIQWGGDYVADQSLGNATGLLFPSTIGIAGGATDGETPTSGGSSQPNYAVNLPAPAGTGTGGAIGFTFGNLAGSFNLNVRLSAAETQGSAKVISAPRVMTLDNTTAQITSGVSIPVSVVSAAGAQTVFFDASLTLNVTPRVTPDGNIFLDVQVTKNEPDFENTGSRGDPSIIRREAATQLLVRDGDTTVIGGIFQRNTGFSTDRVPFFGSLPVIGPLFRNSSRTDVRNELLVFITPRIVNRDLSIEALTDSNDIQMLEDDD